MITRWPSLMVVVVAGGIGLPILAQTEPGPVLPPGFDATLMALFGEVRAFSARLDAWVLDKDGRETARTSGLAFSKLDEEARAEFDMTESRGASYSPVSAVLMRQARMDQVILLLEPRKGSITAVFPRLQAVEVQHDPRMAEAWRGGVTNHTDLEAAETRVIGEETIDGLTCVKHRVVDTDDQGQQREVMIWNAQALRRFPIQMKATLGETTWMFKFRDVELTPPDAKLFEVPAHYLQYTNSQELIQAATHTAKVRLRAWGTDTETTTLDRDSQTRPP